MPKIAPPAPDAKGIYLRKKTYWLRNIVDGKRYFQNLQTHDYLEAVEKARSLRGILPVGKTAVTAWDKAIDKYLKEKRDGVRPEHLRGRRLKRFRDETGRKVRSCIEVFARSVGVNSPALVTLKHLEKYYSERAKKSEAGARSTMATIQAFLDHIQCLPKRLEYSQDRKPEVRNVVVSMDESNLWLEKCQRQDLKFVLYCGFQAGLRSKEIRHSKVSWFDLKRRVLSVPMKETQTLRNGKHVWRTKDDDSKNIPISVPFCEFLKGFLAEPKREFCLVSKRSSKTGLFDFKAPFEKFAAAMGRPDVFPHAMRHSWISELCNSGNHTIMEVVAWSGDNFETIQKNYWKKRVNPTGLDDTMAGRRSGDDLKEIKKIVQNLGASQGDAAVQKAASELLKAMEQTKRPVWKWTEAAPRIHARLYTVEETTADFERFKSLVNPEYIDTDPQLTFEDWEEGKLSTTRARLLVLEEMGLIAKV